MAFVVGLNSGSSLDSIDMVLLDMSMGNDHLPILHKVIGHDEISWPQEVHQQVLRAINLDMGIKELCRLNFVVGAVLADAVRRLLGVYSVHVKDVVAIGVDGQTIYQEPPRREEWQGDEQVETVQAYLDGRYGSTLQIGEGAVISAMTGIPTVTQFRPADIALGGTGAPVEQYLDYIYYREHAPLITLNIGGIANVHAVHPERSQMMAFDTGAGNILMDRLARRAFGIEFDADGKISASGVVRGEVLKHLLEHPFLKRLPPRSAWREDFDEQYLDHLLEKFPQVLPEDIMATLAEFTVQGIIRALQLVPFLPEARALVANGGGIFNTVVRTSLEQQLPRGLTLSLSDEFGIPAKANEAAKFGALGFATIHRVAGGIPHSTGSSQVAVLGKVHWPPLLNL